MINGGRITYGGPVHAAIEHYLETVGPEMAETAQIAHHGTGEARIDAIRIENDSGSDGVLANEPISISTDVEARSSLATDGLRLELKIHDAIGSTLAVLAKDLTGELPLAPGLGTSRSPAVSTSFRSNLAPTPSRRSFHVRANARPCPKLGRFASSRATSSGTAS